MSSIAGEYKLKVAFWRFQNLAFADALYCSFCAPFYTFQALSTGPLGPPACRAVALGRWTLGIADSTSVSLIGLARCAVLVSPKR